MWGGATKPRYVAQQITDHPSSVFAKLREIRSSDERPKDEPAGPAVDHQHALRGSYIYLILCGRIQPDTCPSMASGPDSVALTECPSAPDELQRLLQSLQGRVSALAASRDELALAGQVCGALSCAQHALWLS